MQILVFMKKFVNLHRKNSVGRNLATDWLVSMNNMVLC